MRYFELLQETPLADITTYGKPLDKAGSFSKGDREYMQKAIANGVYKEKLKKIPFNLYVYILNVSGLELMGSTYPEDEINWGDSGPRVHNDAFGRLDIPAMDEIKQAILKNKRKDPSAIHFVMGDNFSDEFQAKPTPWIIAHRFAHTIDFTRLFNTAFELKGSDTLKWYDLVYNCGTMASARNKKLADGEEVVEYIAQYLLTGKIGINEKFAKSWCLNKKRDFSEIFPMLQSCFTKFEKSIDEIIASSAGKSFYV